MNQLILIGNLGADPEMFFSSEGKQVASFNLAFRAGRNKTGWIKVTCFNKMAEVAEKYLHKGARVAVVGSLDFEKWESEGQARTGHKLLCNSIDFIKTDGRGFEDGQDRDEVPF